MDSMMMVAFRDEMQQIKDAGALRDLLMTPIAGTKDWVIPTAQNALKKAPTVLPKAGRLAAGATKRTSQGAFDVSHMARAMGVA